MEMELLQYQAYNSIVIPLNFKKIIYSDAASIVYSDAAPEAIVWF